MGEPFMLGAWQAAALAKELASVLGSGDNHDSVLLEHVGVDGSVVATILPTMEKITVTATGAVAR